MTVLSTHKPGETTLKVTGTIADIRIVMQDLTKSDAASRTRTGQYAGALFGGALVLTLGSLFGPQGGFQFVGMGGVVICLILGAGLTTASRIQLSKMVLLDAILGGLEAMARNDEVTLCADLASPQKTGKQVASKFGMGEGFSRLANVRETIYEQAWLELAWSQTTGFDVEITAERHLAVRTTINGKYRNVEQQEADQLRIFLKKTASESGDEALKAIEKDFRQNTHVELSSLTLGDGWLEANFKEQFRPEESDKALIYWTEWFSERESLHAAK